MKEIRFIDLFAGLGGTRIGFENACKKKGLSSKCVFTSEIKKHSLKVYEENFGNHIIHGDIKDVNTKDIPSFDVLLAGFPCQAFSSAGKRKGFLDTRGTLFFEIERILKAKRPTGFILENVEGLVTHNKKNKSDERGQTFETILNILKEIGYVISYKVLNAKNFGLAQDRKRIFIVGTLKNKVNLDNFEIKKSVLSSILEKNLTPKDTKFTKLLFKHYKVEDLFGKSIKDRRGGSNNIHSWDIGLKGEVSKEQKELLNKLLKERRRKHWAEKKKIKWMDGMPLTEEEIKSFYNIPNLRGLLDDLVKKGYVRYEHPKELIEKEIDGKKHKFRDYDLSKPKGYNIVAGKLSFEISKVLDPKGITPTLVATDLDKFVVPTERGIRRLTIREGLRLFGFPETFNINLSQSKGFDLLGNSIAVPVVESVSLRLLDTLG
jgi:DNA (cytosine-5)-methyltransferase 1